MDNNAKIELYKGVLLQIEAVVAGETDSIANMANVVAILHTTFDFLWTGFYIVKHNSNENGHYEELVLGPFQGPVACTRIQKGRGVCGTSWEKMQTIIVSDVHQFKGHIACSSESNSEIVVPLVSDGKVVAVLDIDSKDFNTFDETDKQFLHRVVELLNVR